VDEAARQDRPGARGPWARRHGERTPDRRRGPGVDVRQRRHVNELAVEPGNGAGACPAQVHRPLGDGVEHGLDVGRRARDHSQDLSGGGLLLQRLGHLRVCFRKRPVFVSQLSEQPDVLDRDDGLGGIGLIECDLRLGERLDLLSVNDNRPDRRALAKNRHPHYRAHVHRLRNGQSSRVRTRFLQIVLIVNDAPLEDCATSNGPGMRFHGPYVLEHIEVGRVDVVVRNHPKDLTIEPKREAERGVAESDGPGHNGVKGCLNVGR